MSRQDSSQEMRPETHMQPKDPTAAVCKTRSIARTACNLLKNTRKRPTSLPILFHAIKVFAGHCCRLTSQLHSWLAANMGLHMTLLLTIKQPPHGPMPRSGVPCNQCHMPWCHVHACLQMQLGLMNYYLFFLCYYEVQAVTASAHQQTLHPVRNATYKPTSCNGTELAN